MQQAATEHRRVGATACCRQTNCTGCMNVAGQHVSELLSALQCKADVQGEAAASLQGMGHRHVHGMYLVFVSKG